MVKIGRKSIPIVYVKKEVIIMCLFGNNSDNSWVWIIVIVVLVLLFTDGNVLGSSNNCGCGCENQNNDCCC